MAHKTLPLFMPFEKNRIIRILIADDHALIRKGLKEILSESPDMVLTGEADNFHEVLQKAKDDNYDVVVMDIAMPGGSALDSVKQLKQLKPDLPILILSVYPEEQYAIRMLKAGASGYLTKESAPDQLLIAIQKVAQGKKYVSSSLAEHLAHNLNNPMLQLPHETLSDREYQVLLRIASGKAVQQVADELHLSKKTVSTYRNRILKKMNMKENAEIVSYAIRNRLIE